jgi:hypothetical protein
VESDRHDGINCRRGQGCNGYKITPLQIKPVNRTILTAGYHVTTARADATCQSQPANNISISNIDYQFSKMINNNAFRQS